MSNGGEVWPSLPLAEWRETKETLHLWTQIVGKVRLVQTPLINHWWNVPLYVTARGLSTSAIPAGARSFEIDFDFIDHRLLINSSDGATRSLPLAPRAVADFYHQLMGTLRDLGIEVQIRARPDEIPTPIPFEEDYQHASYDPEYANRFWRILVQVDRVFKEFRARFMGKASPVHFFWGSFDLAVTRFSGRTAPARENADAITREAYSHEVISHGFWPGGAGFERAAFYAYAAPEPPGFASALIRPASAYYSPEMKEFFLDYDQVREAEDPESALMDFLESTYQEGARLGGWDRSALERQRSPAPITPGPA
jgi:hypothetical protein